LPRRPAIGENGFCRTADTPRFIRLRAPTVRKIAARLARQRDDLSSHVQPGLHLLPKLGYFARPSGQEMDAAKLAD
jgi:hypothetical protein